MNPYLEVVLGLNLGSAGRGVSGGLRTLARAARAAYLATKPVLKTDDDINREELKKIPECELDTLLGERKCQIQLRVMKYEDGMMPFRDALGLLSLLVAEKPKVVLEIGTYMGHTTRAMSENLPDAVIHTLDLPPDFAAELDDASLPPKDDFHLISRRIIGREYKERDCAKRIVQHFGDTAKFDFQRIGRPTFFFIDGSHTFEYCKSDSEKCLALCPSGGSFLWHDCNATHPGVVRFILEWRSQGREIVRIKGTDLAFWKSS